MCPQTKGRKNSLFIGAPEAGQRAAILYTMVEECKRTGTDFYLWLTEVLRKLLTYQTTEGYLNLLPGMRKFESPAQNGRKVTLLAWRQQGFCSSAYFYPLASDVSF